METRSPRKKRACVKILEKGEIPKKEPSLVKKSEIPEGQPQGVAKDDIQEEQSLDLEKSETPKVQQSQEVEKSEPLKEKLSKGEVFTKERDGQTHEKESEKEDVKLATQFVAPFKKPSSSKRSIKRKKKKYKSDQLKCDVCMRQFRDSYNFKRHYETQHGDEHTCNVCSAVFNTEKKLQTHLKKHETFTSSNSVTCPTCSRVFRDNHNMKFHKCSKMNERTKCIIPDCGRLFYHITKMLYHVEREHEGKIGTINLTFDSESQFQCWKEEEELKSFAYFSKRNGTVDLDLGTYRYYICRANGKNVDQPRKTDKKWKKGSSRLSKLCPSRMLVKEVDGKLLVKYIAYHSHDRTANDEKLPVPKSVQVFAKNLLMMGASPQQVRKSVCEGEYGGSNVIPQGGYVISSRYFFEMKKRLETKHNIVIDENRDKYDPVFVYKPHGEPVVVGTDQLDQLPHSNELCAIGLQTKEQCTMMKKRAHKVVCVMSAETHDLYGFEILTLVVPDVFGNGYPVAHILTSHLDDRTLTLLFSCLRERCPSVKMRYVMTDDNVSVFNAISSAFGNVKHFLCHWYIKTNWEIKIRTMCSAEKGELQGSLKAMLYERNKSTFKSFCGNFVEKFSRQYPEFVKYFVNKYLSRVELWAMCCRHCSTDVAYPWPYTNISLHCEYFHNKMKDFIADGSETRRVADVALLLLKIQEGHCQQYNDQKIKGTRVKSAASGKHHNSLLIDDGSVSFSSGVWYVKSRLEEEVKYMVTKKNDSCGDLHCYELCKDGSCDSLCSHLYRCTCVDRADLCEHIHKVHSWRVQQMSIFKAVPKKKLPKHVEVTYTEASQQLDDHKYSYITVLKKEMDDFNEGDVDFVHIDIDEVDESNILYEDHYPNSSDIPLQSQVVEIGNMPSMTSRKGWHAGNYVYTPDYERYGISYPKRTTTPKKLWPENYNAEQSVHGINNDFIKTENVYSTGQKHEPYISINELHQNMDSSTDVPGEKVLILKCIPEYEENGVLIPDSGNKSCIITGKRPYIGTVGNNGHESKKTKIVLGSPADMKIKANTSRSPKSVACQKTSKLNSDKNTAKIDVGLTAPLPEISIKSEYLSEYDDLLAKLAEVEDRQCKYCCRVCRDKYNLKRHIQRVHLKCKYCDQVFPDEQSLDTHFLKEPTHNAQYVCKVCFETFESYMRLKRHKKKHESKTSIQCCNCLRMFRDRYNLKMHQCGKGKDRSQCLYPECEAYFYRISDMMKHIAEVHDDKFSSQTLNFETEKQFKAWKEEEEIRTNALFTKRSGSFKNRSDVSSDYYICQASGSTRKKGNPTRTWRNTLRSGKICPSRMVVRESQGKFTVQYVSSHSHDILNEKKPPHLPESVKELGKQLLMMGVDPKRVRESIQEGVLVNDHLGTYKSYSVSERYFYDMKVRLQQQGCVIPEEKDLTRSGKHLKEFLEVLVSSKSKGYNSVLVYKPQGQAVIKGEDGLDSLPFSNLLFAFGMQTKYQNEMMKEGSCKVVCARSYFSVDTDGYQLINIVVPDKYGCGFPVAHFITNYVDEQTLKLLFTSLQKRCPSIKIPALITDDDLILYEAMQSVFGDVNHYLCHIYIKNCWFQQIEQLIKEPELKDNVKCYLLAMLYERDLGKFQCLSREFTDMFLSSCENFCHYFLDCYIVRPEIWATCYRMHIDGLYYSEIFSNINLHCEYFHNRLGTHVVTGPLSGRMVKLTDLLIKVEKEYKTLYKKKTHTSIPVNNTVYGRHRSGLDIYDNTILKEKDRWIVTSRFNKSKKYTVNMVEKSCNREQCYEKCTEFFCLDLCSHMYTCSCADRAELCEHIHKVHSLRVRSEKPSNAESLMEDTAGAIHVIVQEDSTKEPTVEKTSQVETPSESEPGEMVTHEIFEA